MMLMVGNGMHQRLKFCRAAALADEEMPDHSHVLLDAVSPTHTETCNHNGQRPVSVHGRGLTAHGAHASRDIEFSDDKIAEGLPLPRAVHLGNSPIGSALPSVHL